MRETVASFSQMIVSPPSENIPQLDALEGDKLGQIDFNEKSYSKCSKKSVKKKCSKIGKKELSSAVLLTYLVVSEIVLKP